MSKNILIALGAGAVSAIAFPAFFSGIPGGLLFAYFAPLPLMMAGLGLGPAAGAIAGISGVAVSALAGGFMLAEIYAGLFALPGLMVPQAALINTPNREGRSLLWYPLGNIVCALAIFAGLAIVGLTFYLSGGENSVVEIISMELSRNLSLMLPSLAEDQRSLMVASFAPHFLGIVGISWVFMIIVNGVVAQGILEKMGRSLRPKPRFSTLELPDYISWALVGAAVLGLIGSGEIEYLGENLAAVLSLPFFLLGLATVHTFAGKTTFPMVFLIGIYLFLIVFDMAKLALAAVGLAEQWIGLRRRFAGPVNDKE
jgi:hypothetical protein